MAKIKLKGRFSSTANKKASGKVKGTNKRLTGFITIHTSNSGKFKDNGKV